MPRRAAAIKADTVSASLEFGGRPRTYLVHVPRGLNSQTPLPVVLVLHGATESNDNVEKLSGMSGKADQEHFIAVYPSGTGHLPTWNAGNCCGYAVENHVDDVGFFRALLEKLEHDYAVDRKRVYFTGISNGAMMSYRLACEMSEQVAAIAPVEGALNVDCHPSHAVSVLIFHGTADRLVPYDGGVTTQINNSVPKAVDFWVKRDGCSGAPERGEIAEAHSEKYSACQDGTAVALYAIQGGRHMWPGHVLSGNSVPATDLMWSFFAAHPKP
ncbi:MAG: PHB depolymerase family esterase [Candidatus Acidiferrum sp.]